MSAFHHDDECDDADGDLGMTAAEALDDAFHRYEGEAGPAAAECGGCPFGLFRGMSREMQPDVTLHLLAAARELLLAMETVVRAAEQTVQRNAGPPAPAAEPGGATASPRPGRVRHIDIA